jgi:hypothetical protein
MKRKTNISSQCNRAESPPEIVCSLSPASVTPCTRKLLSNLQNFLVARSLIKRPRYRKNITSLVLHVRHKFLQHTVEKEIAFKYWKLLPITYLFHLQSRHRNHRLYCIDAGDLSSFHRACLFNDIRQKAPYRLTSALKISEVLITTLVFYV